MLQPTQPRKRASVFIRNWDRWHVGSACIQFDYLDDTVVTLGRASPAFPFITLDATPAWFFDTLSPFEVEVLVMCALKRVVAVQESNGKDGLAHDPILLKDAPLLHEHLTSVAFEGGELRKPSSLFIFTEGGLWKACLGERNATVNLWAEADGFFRVLTALEARLGDPNAQWRPPSQQKRRR